MLYGFTSLEPCPKCHSTARSDKEFVRESERLPSCLCHKCEKEVNEQQEAVKQGGVYFKCSVCGINGVLKYGSDGAKKLCDSVRAKLGVKFGEPAGIEFDDCKQHQTGE